MFGPFKEFGISNSKASSDSKFGDNEDPLKNLKIVARERGTIAITSSKYLFKADAKIEIKPYEVEVDAIKLN